VNSQTTTKIRSEYICELCYCSSWDCKQGPVKDVYSLANNPQYKLEVQCPQGGAAVWVLLTRHITDKVKPQLKVQCATIRLRVLVLTMFLLSHSLSRMTSLKIGSLLL